MLKQIGFSCAALLAVSSAEAQTFSETWIDRVVHESALLEQQMSSSMFTADLFAGSLYTYDDNIFLRDSEQDADSILTPFLRARIGYLEPRSEVVIDAMLNYSHYVEHSDASSDEERIYTRGSFSNRWVDVEFSDIFRREVGATDILFSERVRRLINDATMRLSIKLPPVTTELGFNIEHASFDDDIDPPRPDYDFGPFSMANNANYRGDALLAFALTSTLDAIAQGGFLAIDYLSPLARNAQSYFARGGFRGPILPNFGFSIVGGVAYAKAETRLPDEVAISDMTADVELHLRWEATKTVTFLLDGSRRVGFAGGGSAYQIVNQGLLIAEYWVMSSLVTRLRAQADFADPTYGSSRRYFSFGGSGEYQLGQLVNFQGSVTYRLSDAATAAEGYRNLIVQLGAAATF